jgi:hypothetical protein
VADQQASSSWTHTSPGRDSSLTLDTSPPMQVLVSVSTTLMNKLSFPRSTFPYPVSLSLVPPTFNPAHFQRYDQPGGGGAEKRGEASTALLRCMSLFDAL